MTISIAWIRRNKNVEELIVASDSRLRSHGAIDQCHKILRTERGDCCLGFFGDTQIAYPLFVQVSSAINNYFKDRSGATDFSDLHNTVELILNNLFNSWDLSIKGKIESVSTTRILFCGWSWRHRKFITGRYKLHQNKLHYDKGKSKPNHPWAENKSSLMMIGDYRNEYLDELSIILGDRHELKPEASGGRTKVDFDYEPLEALNRLLEKSRKRDSLNDIGGYPQALKIYSFGNDLPLAIKSNGGTYLFGRKLLSWEKTTFPILRFSADGCEIRYPMQYIPAPKDI